MTHNVWFPHGTRMSADFATADIAIPNLLVFIDDVATALRQGSSLASAARAAALRHPVAAKAFLLDERDDILEQTFALQESLTFPTEPLPAIVRFQQRQAELSLGLNPAIAYDLREMMYLCGSGRNAVEYIRKVLDEPIRALFETLLLKGIVVADVAPARRLIPAPHSPSVTRLQHAGLLFRGRTSGVLVDPHFHSAYEPDTLCRNFLRSEFEGLFEAALITHSHQDHWHLPTLMALPPDTTIVVPSVSRSSMLCPDFAATLRALGFKHVVPLAWGAPPFRCGDLEVHAVPFYGEQPLLSERPRHPDLRNHGNTYIVRHDSYSSWLLADAGNDWQGRMSDVAHDVTRQFGTIDWLISNLGEFTPYTPSYITGGHYWLALSPDQLRRFEWMADNVVTLGVGGVAEICHTVQARKFLPYAHWWTELGEAPAGEQVYLDRLCQRLAALRAPTEIVQWHVGQTFFPDLRPA
jgi:L-ascorbate metabolism protein UlaG (beta-lactamase superfamily)